MHDKLFLALLDREFTFAYQPVVHLPSMSVRGIEVLSRWVTPPDLHIHQIVQNGLAPFHFSILLDTSNKKVDGDIDLYLNVSVDLLTIPSRFAYFLKLLRKYPHRRISLEISERNANLLLARHDIFDALARLDHVKIYLDDFGEGQHLSLLGFPGIVGLKISRLFTCDLMENPSPVLALLDTASRFGLEIITEGIETLEQAQWLKDHDISLAQGYFFAPLQERPEFPILREMNLWATKGEENA